MHITSHKLLLLLAIFAFIFQSCDFDPFGKTKETITTEDEIVIGGTIDTAFISYLESNSNNGMQILLEDDYPQAYAYINDVKNILINSPYFNENATIRIVEEPNQKTAFVAPGGYIYLYTGLLKALNYESQLAGVLSCMMACAENNKALEKLENRFSTAYLIDLALGGNLDNINAVLYELRDSPYDSLWVNSFDEKSISAICSEGYNIQGYSDLFFLQPNLKWMRTFPRPSNFAATLYNRKNTSDCSGETDNQAAYTSMKNSL